MQWWWIAAFAAILALGIIGGRSSSRNSEEKRRRGILWMLFLIPRAVARGLWRLVRWAWTIIRKGIPFLLRIARSLLRLIRPILTLLRKAFGAVWKLLKTAVRWIWKMIRIALKAVMRMLKFLWSFIRIGLTWIWRMLRIALKAVMRVVRMFLKLIRPMTRIIAGLLRTAARFIMRILRILAAWILRGVRWAANLLRFAGRWIVRMAATVLRLLRSVRFIRIGLDAVVRFALWTLKMLLRGTLGALRWTMRIAGMLLKPIGPALSIVGAAIASGLSILGTVPVLASIGIAIAGFFLNIGVWMAGVIARAFSLVQLPVPPAVTRTIASRNTLYTVRTVMAVRRQNLTREEVKMPDVRNIPDRTDILEHLRPIGWLTRAHLSVLTLQTA